MAANRKRRLFLIMLMSLVALFIRLHEAHAQSTVDVLQKLTALINDSTPWTSRDPRNAVLLSLDVEIRKLHESGELKNSAEITAIGEKIRVLKDRVVEHTFPRELVQMMMNSGNLWSAQDFLSLVQIVRTQKSFGNFTRVLLRIVPDLSPTQREELRTAFHQSPASPTFLNAFLFETGLAKRDDVVKLLGLFAGEFEVLAKATPDTAEQMFYEEFYEEWTTPDSEYAITVSALKNLTKKARANDFMVLAAITEAKKATSASPHLRARFFKTLTTAGFSCAAEFDD